MASDIKPFERLNADQQKVAIDLAVACSLIVTRLPTISQSIFALVEHDFAAQYDVASNIAKYALRDCGRTLFQTAWSCTVTKDIDNYVMTHFKQEPESLPAGNGE